MESLKSSKGEELSFEDFETMACGGDPIITLNTFLVRLKFVGKHFFKIRKLDRQTRLDSDFLSMLFAVVRAGFWCNFLLIGFLLYLQRSFWKSVLLATAFPDVIC